MKNKTTSKAPVKQSRQNTMKRCSLVIAKEKIRKPHKVVFSSKELRSLEDSSGKDKKKLVKEIKERYGI